MKLRKITEDKKGFLLGEETVKIIISLIAILILISLLVNLYFNKQKAEKQKQAISAIEGQNQIKSTVKDISLGQINERTLNIPAPKGWYLFSFTGNDIKPNECRGKNCLCICSNVWKYNYNSLWTSERERQASECDENGACLVVDKPDFLKLKDYSPEQEIEILGTNVLFKKQGETIEFSEIKGS